MEQPPLIFKFFFFFLCKLNKQLISQQTHYYLFKIKKNLLILTLADNLKDAVINDEDDNKAIPDVDDDDQSVFQKCKKSEYLQNIS